MTTEGYTTVIKEEPSHGDMCVKNEVESELIVPDILSTCDTVVGMK